MAVMQRKGFVYTLEAIIASSLVLGMITVVAPEVVNQQEVDIGDIESGVVSLDKRGGLRDSLDTSDIASDLEIYAPSGYNLTVLVLKSSTVEGSLSAPDQTYLNQNSDYHEIHLWIESASNMNVTFDGESIVSGVDGDYYTVTDVDGTGYLNATGSGDVYYSLESFSRDGTLGDYGDVYSTNYLIWENGSKEVQVRVWQE